LNQQQRADPFAIQRAHTTPRFKRLDVLERYVAGTQYEGMPSWWDDSVALFKRGPEIVYPIVETAISSHVSMILGKMPVLTTAPDEDDEDKDDDFGLSEEDSKAFDRGVLKIANQANLHTAFKQLLKSAMGQKTAVALLGISNGKLTITSLLAKWCKPVFDMEDPTVVKSIEIRYPYLEDYTDPASRKKSKRCMLFRREINDTADTKYEPVEAPKDANEEPKWTVATTVTHDLGFCPIVWYPFLKQETGVQDIDGRAVHEHLLDEINGLNVCLSQKHRAVLYNGDPVIVEIGVEHGFNPTETVEFPAMMKPAEGHPNDPETNKDWRVPNPGGRKLGRKRGPGTVWQYPAHDGKTDVKYLALPPGAMEALEKHIADLELKIAEALHWMPIDPKAMASGATLSGRALEWLHKKQVNFCDDVRPDFANNCALPVVNMLLRIVLRLSEMPDKGLYLAGRKALEPLLKRFMRDQKTTDGQTRKVWVAPHITIKWQAATSDYFTPSEADRKLLSDMTRADLQAGVIKLGTAVAAVAPFYGIENPAQYAEDMEKDAAEKAESLQASQQALAAAAQKPPPAAGAPPKVAARPVRPVTQNGSRKPKPPSAAAPAAPPGKPPQAPGGAQAKVMQ
jgi:hypothetical protein